MASQNVQHSSILSFIYRWICSTNHKDIGSEKASNEKKGVKNNKTPNKFLRYFCDNFILFNYTVIVKQENPITIMILILVTVVGFQSFFILKIYLISVLSSAIFLDICYKYPKIGYPVCMFLKKHSTPEFFALIGNSPFEAFFAKLASSAAKASTKPVSVAVGVALGADYVASTTGLHQLAEHAAKDMYNGQQSYYPGGDPKLNRTPFLDKLIDGLLNSKE